MRHDSDAEDDDDVKKVILSKILDQYLLSHSGFFSCFEVIKILTFASCPSFSRRCSRL